MWALVTLIRDVSIKMEISNLGSVSKVRLGDRRLSGEILKVLRGKISLGRSFLFWKERVTQGGLTSRTVELDPKRKRDTVTGHVFYAKHHALG